jgi:hypothetical protein
MSNSMLSNESSRPSQFAPTRALNLIMLPKRTIQELRNTGFRAVFERIVTKAIGGIVVAATLPLAHSLPVHADIKCPVKTPWGTKEELCPHLHSPPPSDAGQLIDSETRLNQNRDICVTVSSRSGWQRFNFARSITGVRSISGGWSVDARMYAPVGASGHMGRDAQALSPYSQYKYSQNYPFGALLLWTGREYFWIQPGSRFASVLSSIDMRINDSDGSLGDNGGSLTVCFN